MAAIVEDTRYRVPEWLHLEKLAIRVIEVHTGVKIRIPRMWLIQNYGSPVGYPDRVEYADPDHYLHYIHPDTRDNYYEEDYYQFCSYMRDIICPERMPRCKHQLRIYPGKPYGDLIDCGWLNHRQFFRWYPKLQQIIPDPDEVFQSEPMLTITGQYTADMWPYAYITRENMWEFKSYHFYPAVWVFMPDDKRKYPVFDPAEQPKRYAKYAVKFHILNWVSALEDNVLFRDIHYDAFSLYYTPPGGSEELITLRLGDISQYENYGKLSQAFYDAVKMLGYDDLFTELGEPFVTVAADREVRQGVELKLLCEQGTLALSKADGNTDGVGWHLATGHSRPPAYATTEVDVELLIPEPEEDDEPVIDVPVVASALMADTPTVYAEDPGVDKGVEWEYMSKSPLPAGIRLDIRVANFESLAAGRSQYEGCTVDSFEFYYYPGPWKLAYPVKLTFASLDTCQTTDDVCVRMNAALAEQGLRDKLIFVTGEKRVLWNKKLDQYLEGYPIYLNALEGRVNIYSSFGWSSKTFEASQGTHPVFYDKFIFNFTTDMGPPAPPPPKVYIDLLAIEIDREIDDVLLHGTVSGDAKEGDNVRLDLPGNQQIFVPVVSSGGKLTFSIVVSKSRLQGGRRVTATITVENDKGETATATDSEPYDIPIVLDVEIDLDPIVIGSDNVLTYFESVMGIAVFLTGRVAGQAKIGDLVEIELPGGVIKECYVSMREGGVLGFSTMITANRLQAGSSVTARITVYDEEGNYGSASDTETYVVNLQLPDEWLIPCLPMFLLYPHDSYSQFDDAALESQPFRFDTPVYQADKYLKEK